MTAPTPTAGAVGRDCTPFVREQFRWFYHTQNTPVAHLPEREWMFVPFSGPVRRHIALALPSALAEELLQAPAHAYHSVGYYPHPSLSDMPTKLASQTAADLVIDIDCKPGPRPKGDGYRTLNEAWAAARDQTARAIEILEHELGVPPSHLEIAFSGSKGFHIRSSNPDLQALGADARAELGRHLAATGTAWEHLFPGDRRNAFLVPRGAPAGGVPRRIHFALRRIRSLCHPGSRPATFQGLVERHNDTTLPANDVLDFIHRSRDWHSLLTEHPGLRGLVLELARAMSSPRIDQPVLSNMGGMVRLIGSLNGKSGLRCTPVTLERLHDFDPVEDGSPFPKDERLRVTGLRPYGLQSARGAWSLAPGEDQELPLHVAMVFLCSGAARIAAMSSGNTELHASDGRLRASQPSGI